MNASRLLRGPVRSVLCRNTRATEAPFALRRYRQLGSSRQRQSLFWRSLHISSTILGQPELGQWIDQLPELAQASLALAERRYAKAEALLKRGREILAYFPEPERSHCASIIAYRLAWTFFSAERFADAASELGPVVDSLQKLATFSLAELDTISNVCSTLVRAGKYDECMTLTEKILRATGTVPALEHLSLVVLRFQIAASILKCQQESQLMGDTAAIASHAVDQARASTCSNIPITIAAVELATLAARWMAHPPTLGHPDKNKKNEGSSTARDLLSQYALAKIESIKESELKSAPETIQREFLVAKSDVYLALAEIEMANAQFAVAEDHLTVAIDLTDKCFDRHSHRVRHVLEKIAISQINLKKFFFAEGLFRRLEEWYSKMPVDKVSKTSADCLRSFGKMLAIQKRDTEAASINSQLQSLGTVQPDLLFDPEILSWNPTQPAPTRTL